MYCLHTSSTVSSGLFEVEVEAEAEADDEVVEAEVVDELVCIASANRSG